MKTEYVNVASVGRIEVMPLKGLQLRCQWFRNKELCNLFGGEQRLPGDVACASDVSGEMRYLHWRRDLKQEQLEMAVTTLLMLGIPADKIVLLYSFRKEG